MSLSGVRKGDIVRIEGSLHGHVVDTAPGKVQVCQIGRDNVRWFTARQCDAHWKRTAK